MKIDGFTGIWALLIVAGIAVAAYQLGKRQRFG